MGRNLFLPILGGTRQTLTYDAPIPAAQLLTQPCPIYTCVCMLGGSQLHF